MIGNLRYIFAIYTGTCNVDHECVIKENLLVFIHIIYMWHLSTGCNHGKIVIPTFSMEYL